MFSSRSEPEGTLTDFAAAIESARAAGRIRWDLTASNPTRVALPPAQRALLAPAFLPVIDGDYHPDSLGLPAAREAVAGLYRARGVEIPASNVVITSSTSEAYSYLFKLLCDPGDDVLVPAPSYPLLAHLAKADGVSLTPYPISYDGAWHLDLLALRAAQSPRTRAVITVSPNNPTGSYVTPAEFDALGRLGLPVICDEVFAEYPVELAEAPPSAAASTPPATLTFSLGGLSKFAAQPQLKLSWMGISGPSGSAGVEAARTRLELMADSYLSVATPVQAALPAILAASAVTREALHRRVRRNLASLRQACAESPVSVPRVDGGWYAVLRLPVLMPELTTEASWVMRLLGRGILAQPGWFYDFEDEPYLVLSLIVEPTVFDSGVRELVSVVQEAAR